MGDKAITPISKVGATGKVGRPKGTPRTGGRVKGTPNKATASIRDIAREYTGEAINALVRVLRDHEAPAAAVVGAANSLLDRGFGKPSSVLAGDQDGGAVRIAHRIELVGVAASLIGAA